MAYKTETKQMLNTQRKHNLKKEILSLSICLDKNIWMGD